MDLAESQERESQLQSELEAYGGQPKRGLRRFRGVLGC